MAPFFVDLPPPQGASTSYAKLIDRRFGEACEKAFTAIRWPDLPGSEPER